MKAVVAETDATTMADSSVVANATQVVHEGTNKNTPEEMICTSRQKALAADIDLTPMAQSTPVADATQVDDRKKRKRRRRTIQSKHSQRGDAEEARMQTKSEQILVFSSVSSVNSSCVTRDTEEVNVAPASLEADALFLTCDGRGKGVGAKSKGQKLNQMGSANAERPGKCPPRAVSSCVASEETDAQYLAEVAQTNAVLANFKRRRRERHSKSCQVGVKPVRRDDSL